MNLFSPNFSLVVFVANGCKTIVGLSFLSINFVP